jgi:hypothetical protein
MDKEQAQDVLWGIVRDVIAEVKGAYDLTLYGNVEVEENNPWFWRISVVDVADGNVIVLTVAMRDAEQQTKWEATAMRTTLSGLVREHQMHVTRLTREQSVARYRQLSHK